MALVLEKAGRLYQWNARVEAVTLDAIQLRTFLTFLKDKFVGQTDHTGLTLHIAQPVRLLLVNNIIRECNVGVSLVARRYRATVAWQLISNRPFREMAGAEAGKRVHRLIIRRPLSAGAAAASRARALVLARMARRDVRRLDRWRQTLR